MANSYRIDSSEEEALFRSYPYAVYFVQSPSALSHAYESAYQSPVQTFNSNINTAAGHQEATTRLALSRYSSSHGSNNCFLHIEKKKSCDEMALCGRVKDHHNGRRELDDEDEDDGVDVHVDEYYYGEREYSNGWWQYFSFSYSTSSWWICLQIFWRLVLSLMIGLIVFYIAAKPPRPQVAVKMAGVRPFGLGEGVDGSGVTTKILTCNFSMDLIIDNKSKLFGLHIHHPSLQMFFGKLPFAMSQGSELYAGSDGSTLFKLSVGTKNKAMYSAGRNMDDYLKSGRGLPLSIRLSFTSSFNVVWALIQPKYHHKAHCSLLLGNTYDKKHRTQRFNSQCIITS